MKIAVSIPDPVFDAADRLAKQRHVPRSQVVAEALKEYTSRHEAEAVTAKLNDVYAAHESTVGYPLTEAQLNSLEHEAW